MTRLYSIYKANSSVTVKRWLSKGKEGWMFYFRLLDIGRGVSFSHFHASRRKTSQQKLGFTAWPAETNSWWPRKKKHAHTQTFLVINSPNVTKRSPYTWRCFSTVWLFFFFGPVLTQDISIERTGCFVSGDNDKPSSCHQLWPWIIRLPFLPPTPEES